MYRTRIYQETLIDAASSKIDCFFWDKSVNVQLTLVSDHPHHATTRKCSLLLVVYKRNLEKLAPGFLRLATPFFRLSSNLLVSPAGKRDFSNQFNCDRPTRKLRYPLTLNLLR